MRQGEGTSATEEPNAVLRALLRKEPWVCHCHLIPSILHDLHYLPVHGAAEVAPLFPSLNLITAPSFLPDTAAFHRLESTTLHRQF